MRYHRLTFYARDKFKNNYAARVNENRTNPHLNFKSNFPSKTRFFSPLAVTLIVYVFFRLRIGAAAARAVSRIHDKRARKGGSPLLFFKRFLVFYVGTE